MIKNLIFICLLVLFSCSKTNNKKVDKQPEKSITEISLGELNLGLSPVGQLPSGNIDFGSVEAREKISYNIKITNPNSNPIQLFQNDFNLSSPHFFVESNQCVTILTNRKSCFIKIAAQNNGGFASDTPVNAILTIKEASFPLTALFLKDLFLNVGTPLVGISVTPSFLNFGLLNVGDYKEFTVRAKNNRLESAEISVTNSTNPNVFIYRDTCTNRIIGSRNSCFVSFRYSPGLTIEKHNNKILGYIANYPITYSGENSTTNLENPNFLSISPEVPSRTENLDKPAVVSRSIIFNNIGNISLRAPVQIITSSSSIEIENSTCLAGLSSGSSCVVNYKVNSENMLVGENVDFIRLQSGTIASNPFTVFSDVVDSNNSLNIDYNNNELAFHVSELKIWKNNVRCANDCLDSFSQGDVAKVEVISNSAVGVDSFVLSGAYTNLQNENSRTIQFNFNNTDIDLDINLRVATAGTPQIPPVVEPVPSGNGVASIRCYNQSGLDRLSSELQLEQRSQIPSLILSATTPQSADDAIVDGNSNPTIHGWTVYQQEVYQCYNYSNTNSVPLPTTCEERLLAWGIQNDTACSQSSSFDPMQTIGTTQGVSGLCKKYGIGCGNIIETGPNSALCKLFGLGCGSLPQVPIVNLCSDFGLGCNGDTIFPTGPNSVSCKVLGICGGELPNMPNMCKLYGICLGNVPRPSINVTVGNFCNVMNLCDENAICSTLGIGCKGGPLVGPDSLVCKMFGSKCDGAPQIKVDLCNQLGMSCDAVGINSVTCLATGLNCGPGNGFVLSPCTGFGVACGDDLGEVINNVGDEFVQGVNTIGRPIANVINEFGDQVPDITDQEFAEVVLDVGRIGADGVESVGGAILDGAGTVAGVITDPSIQEAIDNVAALIDPANYAEELGDTYEEISGFSSDAEREAVAALENIWSNTLSGADVIGNAISGSSYPKIKTCFPRIKCKLTVKCKTFKCKVKLKCKVKTCVKASTGSIAKAVGASLPKVQTGGCRFPNICGGISGGWAEDTINTATQAASSGWKVVTDAGQVAVGAIATGISGVNGAIQYVKDDLLEGVQFDGTKICEDLGICGYTTPTTCQAFGVCEEGEQSIVTSMCSSANIGCKQYSLKINFNNSILASQLDSVLVYKGGNLCQGDCLKSFRENDSVVVIVDPPSFIRVTDIIPTGTVINDTLILNGVNFFFNKSDITLDVVLNNNIFSYLNLNWNASALSTQTRTCQSQPANSIGGFESSYLGSSWSSCSQFSCLNGFTLFNNSCVPNLATLTINKNSNLGNVFDASFAKINCGEGCLSANSSYNKGSTIILLATPNAGQAVTSWNNCPNIVSSDICMIQSLDNNLSVTANFGSAIISTPCTIQDAQANGVILNNSNSQIIGNKIGSSVAQCLLSSNSCNQYYKIANDSKSCQEKNCIELNSSELIALNINTTGAIISGTYPSCSISCISSLQQVSSGGNFCEDKNPTGTISFQSDYTNNLNLNVVNITSNNASQLQFYSNAGCTNALGSLISLPIASSLVSVSSGDGIKNIYAKFINGVKTSECISDSIILDQSIPIVTTSNVSPFFNNGSVFSIIGTCEANRAISFQEGISSQIGTCSPSGTYSYSYIPSISVDGVKNIIISQTDLAGNIGSVSYQYTRDTVAPTGSITSDDITNNSFETPLFNIIKNDLNFDSMTIAIGLNETDTSIVATRPLQANATNFQASLANTILTANLQPGVTYYTILRVFDKAGNNTKIVSSPWFYGIVPVKVKELATTTSNVCALLTNGTVKCWGSNSAGQLGQNFVSTFQLSSPPETSLTFGSGLSVKKIVGGVTHFCAITSDDNLYCWGGNNNRELGFGDANARFVPTLVNIGSGLTVKDVSTTSHTCVITNTDQVKCWGANSAGQLGYGTISNNITTLPSNLPTLNFGVGVSVKKIFVGSGQTCVITNLDQVKCWGFNSSGQLGNGTQIDISTTPDLVPVVDLGAPGRIPKDFGQGLSANTCVIFDDNSAKCWGANSSSSVGLDTATTRLTSPWTLNFLNFGSGVGVKYIETSVHRSCAALTNNTVKCWGNNDNGELGLGNSSAIKTLAQTSEINLGENLITNRVYLGKSTTTNGFTCAITTNDLTKCWGINTTGRLGSGDADNKGSTAATFGDNLPPIRTRPNLTITQSNSFYNNTNFTLSGFCIPNRLITFTETISNKTQTTMCLSNGEFSYQYSPDSSLVDEDLVRINVSQSTDYGDTGLFSTVFLVDRSPPVIQLTGNSITRDPTYLPALKIEASDLSFSAGRNVQIKVGTSPNDGSIFTTIDNVYNSGALFAPSGLYQFISVPPPFTFPINLFGDTQSVFQPSIKNVVAQTPIISNFSNIQPNTTYYTTVTARDQSNLTTTQVKEWMYVPLETPIGIDVNTISAGRSHSCAISNVNKVYCWGTNTNGQTGQGIVTTTYPTPRIVLNQATTSAKVVTSGLNHSCAIFNDGTQDVIKCWGLNTSGQLGIGSTTQQITPVTVNLGLGIIPKSVHAQGDSTCAIVSDGVEDSLKCWGNNSNGQLGIGSTTQQNSPVSVLLSSGEIPRVISMGTNFSCVLLVNGNVKCWGANAFGQLGVGNQNQRGDLPATAANLIGTVSLGGQAKSIATGSEHACAILTNGSLRCWGNNSNGQLGIAKTTIMSLSPITIDAVSPVIKNVFAGGKRSCIQNINNDIQCVGLNTFGELGIGSTSADKELYTNNYVSLRTYALTKTMSMGENHSCILSVGDTLLCWGLNTSGQLGNNTTINRGSTAATMGDNLIQTGSFLMYYPYDESN